VIVIGQSAGLQPLQAKNSSPLDSCEHPSKWLAPATNVAWEVGQQKAECQRLASELMGLPVSDASTRLVRAGFIVSTKEETDTHAVTTRAERRFDWTVEYHHCLAVFETDASGKVSRIEFSVDEDHWDATSQNANSPRWQHFED
jgi:hypothetical protein